MQSSEKKSAFTLVELLVVVGIISVLIGLLLPSLGRAREQSRRTACLSNLRQVAMAYLLYANDNRGLLPASSAGATEVVLNPMPDPPRGHILPQDFVHFQPARNLDDSVIGKYLGKLIWTTGDNLNSAQNKSFRAEMLRCPSDDYNFRVRNGSTPCAYRFSYVQNAYVGSGYGFNGDDPNTSAVDCAAKLAQIRNSSEKLLLYEEDVTTIDDGHGTPQVWCINLLSRIHDTAKLPQAIVNGIAMPQARGNAAFADGSARYVSRSEMHDPRCYLPKQ